MPDAPIPKNSDDQKTEIPYQKAESAEKRETVLLIASQNGIIEMIKRILEKFPTAIYDTNKDGKNVLLLALENRPCGSV